MALDTRIVNKMANLTKLFNRVRLYNGTISKTTLTGLTQRSSQNVISFSNAVGGATQSGSILFDVTAGTVPNIARLETNDGKILKLGGTKPTKVYMDDFNQIMDNLDGDKEYVVGERKFYETVYPFVLYQVYQGIYNNVLTTGNELSEVVMDNDDTIENIYSNFNTVHTQWVDDGRTNYSKVKVDTGFSTLYFIVRHKAFITDGLGLNNTLTFQNITDDDYIAFDISEHTEEVMDFTNKGRIATTIRHKIEQGVI